MATLDLILAEIDGLITESDALLRRYGWDGQGFSRRPPQDDYVRIRTRGLNLIRRACGENSDHFQALNQIAKERESNERSHYLPACLGIMKAARADLAGGLLTDLRRLMTAEVLGDFLDQAQVLLDEGYLVAAVAVAGAALEDGMRRICEASSIEVPEKPSLEKLNVALAKKGRYNSLVQKRITAIADLRNNADHGRFDKVKHEEAQDMVNWSRRFLADHLM